ncbi:MAG: divergent polysaccharide deacetylase family protein [Alphaproteobacteria bacterium]|nr:divergent polysaccharide deacetylase family protein [Alphaproteobacteria bacterium]
MKKTVRKSGLRKVFDTLGLSPAILFFSLISLLAFGTLISLLLTRDMVEHYEPEPQKPIVRYYDHMAEPVEEKPQPKPKPTPTDITPFERFRLRLANTPKPPMVAIIIDDMGENMINSQKILELDAPLTVAFLTSAPNLQAQIDNARARHKEVLLHVPMEALSDTYNYGGPHLSTRKSASDNIRTLRRMTDHLTGFIGINNHMGSRFTADRSQMFSLLEHLHKNGLAFVDSLTTSNTPSARLAVRLNMKFAIRDVFLDDSNEPEKIAAAFDALETIARKRGYAVAIGHPRPNTIAILKDWLKKAPGRGITVVPVSHIIMRYGDN